MLTQKEQSQVDTLAFQTQGRESKENPVWLLEPPYSGQQDPEHFLSINLQNTEIGNVTLVIGHREQQAWPQNNSGLSYNTGLSFNSQPAFGSLNGWPGEATCFSMVMEKLIPQFTTKLQNVGGNHGLGFEKYSCSSDASQNTP